MRLQIGVFIIAVFVLLACNKEQMPGQNCFSAPAPEAMEQTGGCGNIFLYRFINDTTAVTISIDRNLISLSQDCKEFDLSRETDAIKVFYEEGYSSGDSIYFNYCSDVIYPNQAEPKKSRITEGKIIINVSKDTYNPHESEPYYVSAMLEDLEFKSLQGTTMWITYLKYFRVMVGTLIP